MPIRNKIVLITNIIRGSKYSIVSIISFGIEEGVLAAVLYSVGLGYIILANIAAIFISVAFSFFMNEWWVVKNEGYHGMGMAGLIVRMLKFQAIYAFGSAVGVITQLIIYHFSGINPVIANIGGAIIAYPINYVFSLLIVWKIRIWKE